MNASFLDFEEPLAALSEKLDALALAEQTPEAIAEAQSLRHSLQVRTEQIFSELTPWQVTQVARHVQRPHTQDYIAAIFDDFHEMAGDRAFADDAAIIGGLARFDGRPVMVIGHEKGRDTKQKIRRNFGMPKPEGYRKALRLMELAERFALPIVCLIDTPGAYPGVGAEERGQSEAIARNLLVMAELRVPIVCVVIGEGGSGGALAIGVGDRSYMLEYSVYSVISPEGCASILWKSAERAAEAAEALQLTAKQLAKLGLIDGVIAEPAGGAHRDPASAASAIKRQISAGLAEAEAASVDEMLSARYQRLRSVGAYVPLG